MQHEDYDALGNLTPSGMRRVLLAGGVVYLPGRRVISSLDEIPHEELTMDTTEHNEETQALPAVEIPPADEQALARIISDEWQQADEQAEQFARYEEAVASGIIGQLVAYTIQHGTPEGGFIRWPVIREGVTLECLYSHTHAGLIVRRNGEKVLDEWASEGVVVFDPGKHGRWLQTLLLEHARLERAAKQKARLAQRGQAVAAQERKERDI